jgi:hypothetical protein
MSEGNPFSSFNIVDFMGALYQTETVVTDKLDDYIVLLRLWNYSTLVNRLGHIKKNT